MAKFKFKLDSVLKARRLAEQSHQRIVAGIERERMALEESLRLQQQHIAEAKDALHTGLLGRIDVPALRMNAASTMQLMRHAQRVVLELAGVHRRLDAARSELIEAARHRRAIEILRENRLYEWMAEQNKFETDALDELAVITASRKRGIDQWNARVWSKDKVS